MHLNSFNHRQQNVQNKGFGICTSETNKRGENGRAQIYSVIEGCI